MVDLIDTISQSIPDMSWIAVASGIIGYQGAYVIIVLGPMIHPPAAQRKQERKTKNKHNDFGPPMNWKPCTFFQWSASNPLDSTNPVVSQ